jgi:hypothetical protein
VVRRAWWWEGGERAQLEKAEREELAQLAYAGNWIAMVDADELWTNAKDMERFLAGQRWRPGLAFNARFASVYKVVDTRALVFTGEWPTVFASPCSGRVFGPAGGLASPLKVVNWWLHGRGEDELQKKLRALTYVKDDADERRRLLTVRKVATPETAPAIKGFGGAYRGRALACIGVADLVAGRWDVLNDGRWRQ